MTLMTRSNFQAHPFHLVSPSPWPSLTCLSLWNLTTSMVFTMHSFTSAKLMVMAGLISVMSSMSFWFSDMMSEATFLGDHTLAVQTGLYMGVILFMVSEALFFLSMFWAFFHVALSPPIEMGAHWPPEGMDSVNPFELPLFNTMLLLSSGFTVTFAHHSVMQGFSSGALSGAVFTVMLAIAFTCLQGLEYAVSTFTFADSSFGSCFYFGTGFHGLHVIIGTAFIAVALSSLMSYHFTLNHHLGLEASMLYWHFVDLVWLVLYLSVYWWGS